MAPITIIPKACSCCKGERSSRDKSSNLPLPNILYEGSKGSEGSEGSEGVVAADAASFIKRGAAGSAGCVEGLWKKVLKMDGPSAQGFLSLTALWAEGCGIALRAMSIKSALRDLLSVSYDIISTTVISHLRWLFPPLVPYGTTFPPLCGETIKIRKAIPS